MKTSKSAIFLFELMIIILVFSIAAAVCVSIFAKAFNMSKESEDLTMSAITAQTAAEEYKAGVSDLKQRYYDADWEPATEDKAMYTVAIEGAGEADGLRSANVVVYKIDGSKHDNIFSIPVSKYEGE
jgi:Tfp pilus assembly protein PilE